MLVPLSAVPLSEKRTFELSNALNESVTLSSGSDIRKNLILKLSLSPDTGTYSTPIPDTSLSSTTTVLMSEVEAKALIAA